MVLAVLVVVVVDLQNKISLFRIAVQFRALCGEAGGGGGGEGRRGGGG